MKTIPITISGGFHNMSEITVRAKVRQTATGSMVAEITDSQLTKISRHMCGISDCMCGGGYGDIWDAPEGWARQDATLWTFEA